MDQKTLKFWRAEMALLDRLYRERMREWQTLLDAYDLKFEKRVRDLDASELVRVSRFYPLVRQIIATVAFNYPKMLFTVEDDESEGVADLLERAASALMRLMEVRPHVHQAIFDALFCSVGWLRVDYNPPGDEMIAPYIANDAMHEDLTAVNRIPPGFVHLDPTTPPHMLGHARYIRERMWVPLKFLVDDKNTNNKNQLKATTVDRNDELAFGEPMNRSETPEQRAIREAIDNGDFVLVDRIHDRMNRKLIMFAEGVQEPIQEKEHPFMRLEFPQRLDVVGNLMFDEDGEPLLDLNSPSPGVGFLVEHGLPFIPVKFDLHGSSFYPQAHLKYVEDIQNAIIESVSRQGNLLKRTSRQGVVNEAEVMNNPQLLEDLRRGQDGQWHKVVDPNNFKELNYGSVPPEQYAFEDRMRAYEEQITQVTELQQGGGPRRTATEASLIASSASINREWMEAKVSQVYELIIRNSFQIMADPRYTPENFRVNVSPDGEKRLTRALKSADFLWNYRIEVKTGSMQPLFEQLQRDQALAFYDRAMQRPNFDQMELDKFMAGAFDIVDVEKLLVDDVNPEAERSAQLENDRMMSQMQDPGVVQGQDHQAHLQVHAQYRQHPTYQQMMQQAQVTDFQGNSVNPAAVQMVQFLDQLVAQHAQAHQQMEQQEQVQSVPGARRPAAQTMAGSLQGQVASNAQRVANQVEADTRESMDGA